MKTVDAYFDYASPFAYIASEILPAWCAERNLELVWKPCEISGLSNYANGLPYSEVKRRYVVVDAVRTAEFHGAEIAIPKPHPVISNPAMRLAVTATEDARFGSLHRALARAAWRDQQDLSSPEVLADCVSRAGGAADGWLEASRQPETADRLTTFTREAEERGVFGVPTLVFEGELFWGLDSLPMLEWRRVSKASATE